MPEHYDPNVFAIITAHDLRNMATSALKLPHNAKWFHKATGGVAEKATINSREPTPADQEGLEDAQPLSAVDRLVITFVDESGCRLQGLRFGTNQTSSEILFGERGTKGVSARQYAITVDEHLHIWLHDFYSTHGTAVEYDGQCGLEVRKKETWILAYSPGLPKTFKQIKLRSGSLVINIEFPGHAQSHPIYIHNLRALAETCMKNVPSLESLDLQSGPSTAAPSEPHTPSNRPIYYRETTIGKGAYGSVYKVIKVRDGKYYAAKTFDVQSKKRKFGQDDDAWVNNIRREFSVMQATPHPNVIEVFEFLEIPEPMIIMAYYPIGNMVDAGINDEETHVTAFGQVLDGLSHLHARKIVHRDLKPENLLIERQPYFKVIISDFGFAKPVSDTTLRHTFCGTLKYVAPEIFPGMSHGHATPVDIWSLGVMALEWMYSVPTPPGVPAPAPNTAPRTWQNWILTWSHQLRTKLENEEDCTIVDILRGMLTKDPKRRWSAKQCLDKGFEKRLFRRRKVDGFVICTDREEDIEETT